jgi:hypothetical protein
MFYLDGLFFRKKEIIRFSLHLIDNILKVTVKTENVKTCYVSGSDLGIGFKSFNLLMLFVKCIYVPTLNKMYLLTYLLTYLFTNGYLNFEILF